jgi:WD40 repeat protein
MRFAFLFWVLALAARLDAAPVVALAFSPDGTQLISNGPRCLVIRTIDGAEKARFPCDLPKITALAFQGNFLAIAGGVPMESGAVWLVDWKTDSVVWRWRGLDDLATSVAFNSEGTQVVVASAAGTARVLEGIWVQPLRERFVLRGHAAPVLAAAFLPNDRAVVTTSADRSIKVWATEDGRLIRTFTQHTDSIHALAVRPPSAGAPVAIATVSDDRTLRVWQPEIGRMVRIVRGHESPPFAVIYARDGASIFTAGRDGIVRRFDAESDTLIEQWKAHDDAIYSLALSPDGATLASGDWSGNVKVWKVKAPVVSPAR